MENKFITLSDRGKTIINLRYVASIRKKTVNDYYDNTYIITVKYCGGNEDVITYKDTKSYENKASKAFENDMKLLREAVKGE